LRDPVDNEEARHGLLGGDQFQAELLLQRGKEGWA
jgi:hypothetical protein